jgi:NADPH:quinone reductase-like Zn-dependent oxidoreductase
VEVGTMAAPTHRSDQLLVRVHASSVNPADVKVCTGAEGASFIHARRFPTAFGFDFSGVVEQVGTAAPSGTVGDEVFGHLPYSMTTRQGAFADYIAVVPDQVGLKPIGVSHEDAASSATVGLTALQALRDKGRLKDGQRVLVNGASGGVGSFAVQIAKVLGAEVWGTSSAAKADFVRSLGAAEVVDYRKTSMADLSELFDVILDAASASSYAETKHLLTRHGAYVTLLPSASLLSGMANSAFSRRRCTFVTVKSRKADLEQLAAWLASGELNPSVQATYDLEHITDALSELESGNVRGKIAVRVRD